MSRRFSHVVVVGGGIVGAACAEALSADGVRVTVCEAEGIGGGATAAGMGHVVAMDDSPAQFALTRYSQQLWNELAPRLPVTAEQLPCGTIWVAADDEEMQAVYSKMAFYRAHSVACEVLDARQLAVLEPHLRQRLAGGLLVPGDCVLYPPPIAEWLLQQVLARGGAVHQKTRVAAVSKDGDVVEISGGTRITCDAVVVATGVAAAEVLPGLPVRPRKGHLVITDRHPGFVRHQLIELGYLKSAHGPAAESVAFNVQPRPTGQVLIGSSRQLDRATRDVEMPVLQRMLRRAALYMPGISELSAIRAWTGFRAATPDNLPLIGPLPHRPNVILATGHEGLGITTSLATGRLVADYAAGREPGISPEPYLPQRFAQEVAHA